MTRRVMTKQLMNAIKAEMKLVVYRSADWHELCLALTQLLCAEGDIEEGRKQAERIDVQKLVEDLKPEYHLLLARLAEVAGDQGLMIRHVREVKKLDRQLDKPTKQFSLTKEIAYQLDSLGRFEEAANEWKLLIEDFKNFSHPAHQPLIACKFQTDMFTKAGLVNEAESTRRQWVADRVTLISSAKDNNCFVSADPPPNYCDKLTDYFERSRQCTFILYEQRPELVGALIARNAEFIVGIECLHLTMSDLLDKGSDSEFADLSDAQQLPYFFFMRANSTYLTSVELAASGRIPEAFGALRMCLENSFYAFHLSEHPESAAVWLDRPLLDLGENDSVKIGKRKKIAATFSPGKIITDITSKSEKIGAACRYYYEMSIDEGAHPNVDVFRRLASQKSDESTYRFGVDFINQSLSTTSCETVLAASEVVLDVFRLGRWIW